MIVYYAILKNTEFELDRTKFENTFPNSANEANDFVILTLNAGSVCRMHPGLTFEIISYDRSTNNPGYIKPLGLGVCDIFSSIGNTVIQVSRHSDLNSLTGFLNNDQKKYQIGPFRRCQEKVAFITNFINFNFKGNFTESMGPMFSIKPDHKFHMLIFLTNEYSYHILDFRSNAIDKFSQAQRWEDVYKGEFSIDSQTMDFNTTFVQTKESLDLANSVPTGVRIKKLICRTDFDDDRVGAKLVLTNGMSVRMLLQYPDNDCTIFNIPSTVYLMIPKKPTGNIISFTGYPDVLADVQAIGYKKIPHNSSNTFCLFSNTVSMDNQRERSVVGLKIDFKR